MSVSTVFAPSLMINNSTAAAAITEFKSGNNKVVGNSSSSSSSAPVEMCSTNGLSGNDSGQNSIEHTANNPNQSAVLSNGTTSPPPSTSSNIQHIQSHRHHHHLQQHHQTKSHQQLSPPPISQTPSSSFSTVTSSYSKNTLQSPNNTTVAHSRHSSTHGRPMHPHQLEPYGLRPNVRTPISPAPRTPDDELLAQLSCEELIGRIKSLETKNRRLLFENGCLMKDLNSNLAALQHMKQQNQQLLQDNNELRDLCCYLDDERARARSIAQEWSSFGSHMSKVSQKLAALEQKQFELVRENYELKQLCLLLDNAVSVRENGDGSSGNSFLDASGQQLHAPTSVVGANISCSLGALTSNYGKSVNLDRLSKLSTSGNSNLFVADLKSSEEMNKKLQDDQPKSALNRQILEYIKSLEERITELELDRKQRTLERTAVQPTSPESAEKHNLDVLDSAGPDSQPEDVKLKMGVSEDENTAVKQRCPTVINEAMNVLRIQQSIEDLTVDDDVDDDDDDGLANDRNNNELSNDLSTNQENPIGDGPAPLIEQQKQIVRQLCDAALRKIEDG